jgi:hypothetical protein
MAVTIGLTVIRPSRNDPGSVALLEEGLAWLAGLPLGSLMYTAHRGRAGRRLLGRAVGNI